MTKNVSAGDLIKKLFTEKIIYVVLLALIIVIICIEPRFLSIINFSNILAQSSTRIIIALGAGMVLMVRGCDLSTGRMIGLAAVISASLLQNVDYAYRMYQNLPSLPIIVPLLLVIALCALLGTISGTCVAKLKVPPIIATLAMQLVLYGASYHGVPHKALHERNQDRLLPSAVSDDHRDPRDRLHVDPLEQDQVR